MNPLAAAYGLLALAIAFEVAGTSLLQTSEQFTRLWPTLGMAVLYAGSFFLMSHALKAIPLGVAYAIWGGLGVVLVAVIGAVVFRQALDLAAILGIGMIVSGVVVINAFSKTGAH